MNSVVDESALKIVTIDVIDLSRSVHFSLLPGAVKGVPIYFLENSHTLSSPLEVLPRISVRVLHHFRSLPMHKPIAKLAFIVGFRAFDVSSKSMKLP